MDLYTNLHNPISSLYKYMFRLVYIQKYNTIYNQIKPHVYKFVH